MKERETLVAARGESGAGAAAHTVQATARRHAGHPQGDLDCFDLSFADTHAAMREETPEGLPTFAHGARSAHLIDAVLASAAAGAWVEVP